LIKDIAHEFVGQPTTHGSRALRDFVPRVHLPVVRRFLQAGLAILGKTKLPELARKAVTDPQWFGRSSNPWGLDRRPGGSSGGSIRILAAYCRLFGMRRSRGRISCGPVQGQLWHGASSEGVISRSVRVSARALDVLRGPEPGDPFVISEPPAPHVQLMMRDPGRLRIGFSAVSPIETQVHPQAVAAVQQAAQPLRRFGHDVEEATPAIDGKALARSYLHTYHGTTAASVAMARPREARDRDFEFLTLALETLGKVMSAGALSAELEKCNGFARALGNFHRHFDLLLTPTAAQPPVNHGVGDPTGGQSSVLGLLQRTGVLEVIARLGRLDALAEQIVRASLQYIRFTQLANLTGTSATSVPLHWTPEGLPIGVQFLAPFGAVAPAATGAPARAGTAVAGAIAVLGFGVTPRCEGLGPSPTAPWQRGGRPLGGKMPDKPLDSQELDQIVQTTIEHYEHRAAEFESGTRDHDVRQNIDALLRHVTGTPPFTILDFGCGPGRDLKALTALGHRAIGLEGTPSFVAMARADSGCDVWQQDFLHLTLPDEFFDGIYANASLFHVPAQELPRVLAQLREALKPRGVLFSSNPRGDNVEGWSRGRYGAYHDLPRWREFLRQAGFTELEHFYRPAGLPCDQQPWLASVWQRGP
jgi:amidase